MVGQAADAGVLETARLLEQGKTSSEELTRDYLRRARTLGPHLNCYISLVEEESALEQARAADQRRAQGTNTPLSGIPLAHKDIFCTLKLPTSCASRMLEGYRSPIEATVVRLLREAGMVCLGKTNMDEFAMGSSNETSYFGPVLNPWDLERVPGGSSGGSAAAVAAHLIPAATGTDTGGSIRQPAALCGVTGLKPTYGRVSRYGMVAFASSLDQAGTLTRSAADAALLLRTMAGPDPLDSTTDPRPVQDYLATLENPPRPVKGLRIGLPRQFMDKRLDGQVGALVQQAAELLQQQGALLREVELPHQEAAVAAYCVIAAAECSSNLARFDGVRYGYRCQQAHDLRDLYLRSRTEGFGTEVKRRVLTGTHVLSAGYHEAYYLQALKVRRLIRDEFLQAFEDNDLLLGPTSPTVAFRIGEKTADPITMYLSDVYTVGCNLAGLPALSIPVGFSQDLPVGMQLIGPHFSESLLLQTAHHYQKLTDWHLRRPPEPAPHPESAENSNPGGERA